MGDKSVGERIAALRAVRGLTGEQLGRVLGLTKSQVSKIENGTRKLDVSEVALVADALGITLSEVLGVERKGSLALAARVMTASGQDETAPARRRVRQVLEAEAAARDNWLQRAPTSVLRAAGNPAPAELTWPNDARRVSPRLLSAAQHGYQNGRIGLGLEQ